MPDTPEGESTVDGAESDAFLGTYKTKEDALKGMKERSDKISQQGQENAELRARLAAAEGNAELLKTLTEKVAAKPEPEKEDPQAGVDAVVKQIAKAMEDGDYETAARLNLQVQSGWIGQSEAQLKAELKATADSLGVTVKELKAAQAEQALAPDVKAHGEAAKALADIAGVELGSENLGMFLKLAKAQATTDQPERHDLPGGSVATRVVGESDDGGISVELRKALGVDTLSPEKQKEWLRMQKAKVKAVR